MYVALSELNANSVDPDQTARSTVCQYPFYRMLGLNVRLKLCLGVCRNISDDHKSYKKRLEESKLVEEAESVCKTTGIYLSIILIYLSVNRCLPACLPVYLLASLSI